MPILTTGRAALVAASVVFCWGNCQSASAQTGSTYKLVAFSSSSDTGYSTFGNPKIGADGTVAFLDDLYEGEGHSYKVLAGLPGSLRTVAESGKPAPGLTNGYYESFSDLSVSKDGLVAFNAGISNDGFFRGIFAETTSSVQLIATTTTTINGSVISALGPVAYRSGIVGAKGQETFEITTDALYYGMAKTFAAVLSEGASIAGKVVRTIYDSDTETQSSVGTMVDINESGSAVFKVIASPSPSPAPRETIYAGNPSAPVAVATQYNYVPGVGEATYEHLSAQPTIAANGLLAFSAVLSGGPGSAIFSGTAGAVLPLVVQGTTVPTTTDVVFGTLSDAVVNSNGDVIFRAEIEYPNESTRKGIWLKRQGEVPVLIAVSGISLPTPNGQKVVTDVDFAGPGTFNDLHEFVFRATFDGGQGIYIADTRPGAPIVTIVKPAKPRDRVTTKSSILVAGTATDVTGVEKVEYTVASEKSAKKKNNKRGKRWIVSRKKMAEGGTSWKFKVPLSMGLNLITITATDKLGNVSGEYKVRILRYDPDAP